MIELKYLVKFLLYFKLAQKLNICFKCLDLGELCDASTDALPGDATAECLFFFTLDLSLQKPHVPNPHLLQICYLSLQILYVVIHHQRIRHSLKALPTEMNEYFDEYFIERKC